MNCHLTGIDINQRFLEHGRINIDKNVNWIQSDVENLPFRDGCFDLVYCLGVLSYLKEDKKAIAEMSRVTKEDGTVIVSVPNLLMINKFIDPYYYFAWLPYQLLIKKVIVKFDKTIKKSYETSMIRRYVLKNIVNLSKTYNLNLSEIKDVSYGPFTIWRKSVIPLSSSIRISEKIRTLTEKRTFKTFINFSNHWIICFQKIINDRHGDLYGD